MVKPRITSPPAFDSPTNAVRERGTFCSKKQLEGDRADAMLFLVGLVGGVPSLPVRQPCRCRVRDWGHGKV
jgi:hypothetical protein